MRKDCTGRTVAQAMAFLFCSIVACKPGSPTLVLKVDRQLPLSNAAQMSGGLLEDVGSVQQGDSDKVARYYSVRLNEWVEIKKNATVVLDYPVVGESPYFRLTNKGNGQSIVDGDTIVVTKVQAMKLGAGTVDDLTKALRAVADSIDAHKE